MRRFTDRGSLGEKLLHLSVFLDGDLEMSGKAGIQALNALKRNLEDTNHKTTAVSIRCPLWLRCRILYMNGTRMSAAVSPPARPPAMSCPKTRERSQLDLALLSNGKLRPHRCLCSILCQYSEYSTVWMVVGIERRRRLMEVARKKRGKRHSSPYLAMSIRSNSLQLSCTPTLENPSPGEVETMHIL